jgi:hypothetical protein
MYGTEDHARLILVRTAQRPAQDHVDDCIGRTVLLRTVIDHRATKYYKKNLNSVAFFWIESIYKFLKWKTMGKINFMDQLELF